MDATLAWIVFGPAVVMAAILLVVWWQFVREKNFQNGLYFWQRSSLYKRGALAKGKVMEVVQAGTISGGGQWHMSASLMDLVVEVQPASGTPWRASMHYLLSSEERDLVSRGSTVPLRYDAANPKKLVIDWPALRGPTPR